MVLLTVLTMLFVAAVGALFIGALHGAGRELGRASLAESAPWIARVLPRVVIRILRLGRPDTNDLEAELDSLVDRTFEGQISVSDRTRALLVVIKESIAILRRFREFREAHLVTAGEQLPISMQRVVVLLDELAARGIPDDLIPNPVHLGHLVDLSLSDDSRKLRGFLGAWARAVVAADTTGGTLPALLRLGIRVQQHPDRGEGPLPK